MLNYFIFFFQKPDYNVTRSNVTRSNVTRGNVTRSNVTRNIVIRNRVIRIFILNKKFPSILSKKKMPRRNTVINPLTGRAIQIGGATYNQLIISAYDHINGELVRRNLLLLLPTNDITLIRDS